MGTGLGKEIMYVLILIVVGGAVPFDSISPIAACQD